MATTGRVVAEGANSFRRAGALERMARQLARVDFPPSVRRTLKRVYVRALSAATGGRGLESVLPGGETVRVLPEYASMCWNPVEYAAFREAVRPGITALDVGANVGAYSLLLGQWVGAAGRVFAFEPAPQIFDALSRHVHLNALDAVVTPVEAAVAASMGTARLVVSRTAGESRLAMASDAHAQTREVAVTTIDAFCAREGLTPAFIKIDVEGAELEVLRGARETIARSPRLALFVEMHASAWRASGIAAADVQAELEHLGLRAEPLEPSADPWAVEGLCMRLVPRR